MTTFRERMHFFADGVEECSVYITKDNFSTAQGKL